MNVEQIVKIANFDYNPHVPLRYWLRTAGTLVKEVCGNEKTQSSGGFIWLIEFP